MKKVVLIFLTVLILFLSGLLIYNINNLNELKENNKLILNEIKDYESNMNENNLNKENYEKELEDLKNNSKDKIGVYEKWNKWTNEIKEKIS